jgi:hypothetical protein
MKRLLLAMNQLTAGRGSAIDFIELSTDDVPIFHPLFELLVPGTCADLQDHAWSQHIMAWRFLNSVTQRPYTIL